MKALANPVVFNFVIYYAQSIADIITANFIVVCFNEIEGFSSSVECLLEIRIYQVCYWYFMVHLQLEF